MIRATVLALVVMGGAACAASPATVHQPCGAQLSTHAEDDACVEYQRADGVHVVGPLSSWTRADGAWEVVR